LSKKPGGCVKKTARRVQKSRNRAVASKKSKPGGCVKKVETGRLRQKNARSRPKKVETARLRQKNARSRPKAENARLRPKRPVASIFLTISPPFCPCPAPTINAFTTSHSFVRSTVL
jgi:hypothetical protein